MSQSTANFRRKTPIQLIMFTKLFLEISYSVDRTGWYLKKASKQTKKHFLPQALPTATERACLSEPSPVTPTGRVPQSPVVGRGVDKGADAEGSVRFTHNQGGACLPGHT